jgi:hypothetical protein
MRLRRPSLVVLLSLLLFSTCIGTAHAGWPNDPGRNVCVTTSSPYLTTGGGGQSVSDGAGGTVVGWWERRAGVWGLYAQRISSAGQRLWAPSGVLVRSVSTWTSTHDSYMAVASDGEGGILLAWYDPGVTGDSVDVRVQRVDYTGAARYQPGGAAAGTATADAGMDMGVAPDGFGGCFVAWPDIRNYASCKDDVYAQHISNLGAASWTIGGASICGSAENQYYVRVIPAGTGFCIVSWEDWRNSNWDIYAQKLGTSGSRYFGALGIVVCGASANQVHHSLAPDGAGGAFFAWEDYRSGVTVYLQRITAQGYEWWSANGIPVVDWTGYETEYPQLAPDEQGGVVVAWTSRWHTQAYGSVLAQHVGEDGTQKWGSTGHLVCQYYWAMVGTVQCVPSVGGAVVAWADIRNAAGGQNIADVYAQRLYDPGLTAWVANGVKVSESAYPRGTVEDAAGGAIFGLATASRGVCVQKVDAWGQLGAQPVVSQVKDVPNDEGGKVKLSWEASPLDNFPDYGIYNYQVFRSVPPNLATRALEQGHAVGLSPGQAAPAAGGRAILVRGQGSTETAWEYVGTVPGNHLSAYSYLAPTAGDSVGGSNPSTLFMVEARGTNGGWWFSDPDSGYSVDNLAPAAPAYFTARFGAGVTRLHWPKAPESDFSEFRLYRDSRSDFEPGPGNLVVAQADTGYTDAVTHGYFYKLTTVDVHGNVGPYRRVWPVGAGDVPDGPLPLELALSAPAPNPSREGAAMRLSLPRAARVSLVVFDQQGRRVRTLVEGDQPAGERTVAWDGRDDSGRPVSSAVYFVRMEGEGRVFTRRVALVR